MGANEPVREPSCVEAGLPSRVPGLFGTLGGGGDVALRAPLRGAAWRGKSAHVAPRTSVSSPAAAGLSRSAPGCRSAIAVVVNGNAKNVTAEVISTLDQILLGGDLVRVSAAWAKPTRLRRFWSVGATAPS